MTRFLRFIYSSSSVTLDLMFQKKVPRKTELKIIVLMTGNILLGRNISFYFDLSLYFEGIPL